jgi:phospholipase C
MKRLVLVVTFLLAAPAHAGVAACPFTAGALPADTLPAGAPRGAQIPLDTIVVLMQENRSFDHYFGRLHFQGKRKSEGEPRDARNPDPGGGASVKAFHQRRYCEVADLDHSWNGTHREWNEGAMDGFTAANVDAADPNGSRTMGYYDHHDLPFYYALYRKFATGD